MAFQPEDLAINGGQKVREDPLPPWPCFCEEEKQAVRDVLDSNDVNYWVGARGMEFEHRHAKYHGVRYAVAVSNGGAALHAALAAAGVGPGDEVIVAPFSFIASAMCVLWQNAVPVFADVDAETLCISSRSIQERITDRTKAIIPVHLYGQPCDMDPIMELAQTHDLVVIEDCAQAHGAEYKGRKVGSIGHIGAFSFCQTKIVTTGGEGGMLTTNDDTLNVAIRSFKDYGKCIDTYDGTRWTGDGRWGIGYNLRMTEMQAAIGLVWLEQLDEFIDTRRASAEQLMAGLADIPAVRPLQEAPETRHAYWEFPCLLDTAKLSVTREQFVEAAAAECASVRLGTTPMLHTDPVFTQMMGYGDTKCPFQCPWYQGQAAYGPGLCPTAETLGPKHLCIGVHPTFGEDEMKDALAALAKVAEAYAL